MDPSGKRADHQLLLVGFISAFGVASIFAAGFWFIIWPEISNSGTQTEASAQPVTEYLGRFTCKKGLTRWVSIGGAEDGFAQLEEEPSRIRSGLMANGYFSDLQSGRTQKRILRQYDEPGADKTLVDYFEIPRNVVSGKLIIRAKAEIENQNDRLTFGDFDELARSDLLRGMITFSTEFAGYEPSVTVRDGSMVFIIDFADFTPGAISPVQSSFLEYLNTAKRIDTVDFSVADDTAIDVAAVAVCLKSAERKGTTFTEFRHKPISPEFSWLGCDHDFSQQACDPFAGDRLCSSALPVACYTPGKGEAPPVIRRMNMPDGNFVGGKVQLSSPVPAERFNNLAAANSYCAATFGAGSRVLSYHEGGGHSVISRSKIALGSRAWINVADSAYGNCWAQ